MDKIFTANDRARELGHKNHREFLSAFAARNRVPWSGQIDLNTTPLNAFVDGGRWLVRCECLECTLAEPHDPIHYCPVCGNINHGGKARPVVFPDNRKEIEDELLKREWVGSPEIFDTFGTQTLGAFPAFVQHKYARREWKPGQSVKALKAELAVAKKKGARTIHFSYSAVPTVSTSDSWSAAQHNTYIKDNLADHETRVAAQETAIKYSTIVLNTDTALTSGDDKIRIPIPASLNGFNLVSVVGFRSAGTGTLTIQLNNHTLGQDILSTRLTIDTGETSSTTAATAAVINTSYDHVATNDIIAFDVDDAGTSTLHCTVVLGYQEP